MNHFPGAWRNARPCSLTVVFLIMLIAMLALGGCASGGSAAQSTTTAQPSAANQAPAATEAPAATQGVATGVSFAKDVMPVFEQTCIKCHGGDKTEEALSLKTYADTMAGSKNGAVVKPGDPANSQLVKLIQNGKMPKRAPKLPQETIDLIAQWVKEGAPNN